jgi:hypothetical protein
MTLASRRGARREREAAALLGSKRVLRERGERAPDVVPLRFANGTVVVPESKTRAKLPKWINAAIEQARRYHRGAVPLVVLSETGGPPLALLPLADLAMLVGLRDPRAGKQLLLLGAEFGSRSRGAA